ncbi:small-subunit processome [Cunninghamella echinulata]|nr:small-subunit processome [Cunninghamella echinulata]
MARPQKKGNYKKGKSISTAPYNNRSKGKGKFNSNHDINDVFEAADDERKIQRKGHELDEVEDFEYQVGDIQGDDDEEIDSDEAFDDSDDEKFDHFKFNGSTKQSDKKKNLKKKKAVSDSEDEIEKEINLNETDDEDKVDEDEEDMEGSDYMDLADMLDEDESDDDVDSKKKISKTNLDKNAIEQLLLDNESDEDESDEDINDLMDDISDNEENEDSDDDENDKSIVNFITSLETKKRKRNDDGTNNKKLKALAERSEIYQENEFNLSANKATANESKKKLDLKDLMGSIEGEASLGDLRNTMKTMQSSVKTKATVDAPLPKRIQDRLERQAAYKEATKEISKWDATVQENRQAEHLSFPMQHASTKDKDMTSATLTSTFKPNNDMEQQIQEALKQAGMKDEDLEEYEGLKLNKLSIEEVEERRKELAMMRELMYRHEKKAKRMKKIKSKSYRKLKRQEKAKKDELMAKLQEVDHEMDDEEKMNAAVSRAEERMTLKHKNTGKWAKRALARGQLDEGTREAIMEQLERGEKLKRKIQGVNSDDSDDDSDDDFSDSDDDNQKEKMIKELNSFAEDLNDEDNDTQPKKGIFAMKFMQDAEKRKLHATKVELDEFKNEWLDENSDNDEKVNEDIANTIEPNYAHIENNPGRIAFGAKKNALKKQESKTNGKDQQEVNVKLNDAGQIDKVALNAGHNTRTSGTIKLTNKNTTTSLSANDNDESNPWLQNDTSRLSKQASKNNKADKKKKKSKNLGDNEEDVELNIDNALSIKKATANNNIDHQPKSTIENRQSIKNNDINKSDNDDDDDQDDTPAPTMIAKSNKVSFNQRELVARAFANDNVVEEFEQEKEAIIAEDDDKVEDMTLPGWGSWGGSGIKKVKNKKKIIKVTKGINRQDRKDAKLSNVIINEKRHKKAEKYQATQVPFPFKTMEQYEQSLRTPMGTEWNTNAIHQKMTKPRVLTKLGAVINPLSVPFK